MRAALLSSGQTTMDDNEQTADETLTALKYRINKRLVAEGRWTAAATVKDDLIREARAAGVSREDAQRQAYLAVEKLFPPLNAPPTADQPPATTDGIHDDHDQTGQGDNCGRYRDHLTNSSRSHQQDNYGAKGDAAYPPDGVSGIGGSDTRTRGSKDGSLVVGLGDLPESWGKLPPNAPLAQEIQWVQANRLQCVTDDGEQAQVDLSKALTPAPSYAALGWLETSIRAYTKFVDVAAKATAQLEDEREHVRRERMAIEEIRKLLTEMVEG